MMSSGDVHGVIFNVDSVLRMGSLRRLLGRLRSLRTTSLRDRRSMLAMPRLVRALSADLDSAPVFYVTAFPIVLARPITKLLKRDGYPSGTLLTTGRSFALRWVVRGSRSRKLAGIERLADRMPNVRWVLIGDDGGYDPQVFADFAHRRRDRVAVIALRQVVDVDSPKINLSSGSGAPSARPWSGHRTAKSSCRWCERLSGSGNPGRVRSRTGSSPSSNAAMGPPASGRGPRATRSARWCTDVCTTTPWPESWPRRATATRSSLWGGGGDADQLLADGGPTVVEALTGAASRGARVRGLLWHAHAGMVGSQVGPNRMLALAVNTAGGEVFLDQRVLPFGCHHQKMVVVRHARRPQDDAAFLGGIDLDHGSRDDADHRGDRQSVGADPV
jgi:hypothetical protein